MSTAGMSLMVAVPAAIVGAACMGLASAAQARATKEVPASKTLHPAAAAGPGAQAGLADRHRRHDRGSRPPGAGAGFRPTDPGAAAAGVRAAVRRLLLRRFRAPAAGPGDRGRRVRLRRGTVRIAAAGQADRRLDHLVDMAPLGGLSVALGVVAAGGLVLSSAFSGPLKVLGLALATGVFYGITAGLMKVVAGELRTGIGVAVPALDAVRGVRHRADRLPAEPEHVPAGPHGVARAGRDHHGRSAGRRGHRRVVARRVGGHRTCRAGRRDRRGAGDRDWASSCWPGGPTTSPGATQRPQAANAAPVMQVEVSRLADPASLALLRSSIVQHLGPPPDLRSSDISTGIGW